MAAGQSLWTFQIWDDITPPWRVLRFTSGGTAELVSGDNLVGATSGASAFVVAVKTRTGTWAGGDAAGYIVIKPTTGTFQSENLNQSGGQTNIATTGAASLAGNPSIADNTGVGIRSKDFDDTNIELCVFHAIMPRYYDGGGLDFNIQHFSTDTATTTDGVVLDIFLWRSNDGIGLGGGSQLLTFSLPNSVTAAVADASFEKDIAQIQFSDGADMDSIAAGEEFYVILARDAQHTSDDAAGDLQLVEVELRETP